MMRCMDTSTSQDLGVVRLDPTKDWRRDRCPMAATLGVVSTRTAFLLLREAFYGAHRFEEFVRRAEVSEPVAAVRLREFVEHGLMERLPYRDEGQRTRSGYRLTEKGRELFPAVVALMDWGNRWALDDGPRVELGHAECGEAVHAVLRCDADHDVDASDVELFRRPPAR